MLTHFYFSCSNITGGVEKIDWVIHSALTVFADAEDTGAIEEEASSEEEVSDDEE